MKNDWNEYLLALILFMLCVIGNGQTLDQVKKEIEKQGIEYPEIVLAQVIEETGWLKCQWCSLRFNNLFGMRLSRFKRPGNINGYILYENWIDSIRAYKKWQMKHFKGGNYFEFLKRINYATNPKYIQNLKSHIKKITT